VTTLKQLNWVSLGLWLALVLALVGSLRHVAWTFSTLEGDNMVAGYIQAIAIDVGLFALAFGVQQRKRTGKSARWLWLGVVLFSAISAYANLLHGLHYTSPESFDWWAQARPYLLAGALPLLVFYLSEILSSGHGDKNSVNDNASVNDKRAVMTMASDKPSVTRVNDNGNGNGTKALGTDNGRKLVTTNGNGNGNGSVTTPSVMTQTPVVAGGNGTNGTRSVNGSDKNSVNDNGASRIANPVNGKAGSDNDLVNDKDSVNGTMSKKERLSLLKEHTVMTAERWSDMTGVSVRTAYRDMTDAGMSDNGNGEWHAMTMAVTANGNGVH
jgi:hypothetical protein